MIITVETQASPPTAWINITQLPTGTVTLDATRTVPGQPVQVLRDAARAFTGTAGLIIDYEAPVGVVYGYTVKALGGQGQQLDVCTVQVPAVPEPAPPRIWISDPLDPLSRSLAVRALDGADGRRRWSTKISFHQTPQGLPFAARQTSMTRDSIPIDLFTDDPVEDEQIKTLLTGAIQLVVRFPAWRGLPPVIFGVVNKLQHRRSNSRFYTESFWSFDLDPVRQTPLGAQIYPWTYNDLAATGMTYNDLAAAGMTYLDLRKGI